MSFLDCPIGLYTGFLRNIQDLDQIETFHAAFFCTDESRPFSPLKLKGETLDRTPQVIFTPWELQK